MKKSIKILLIILVLLVALGVTGFSLLSAQFKPVNKNTDMEYVRIEIPSGTSTLKIAEILKENNVIKSEKIFYYAARYSQLLKLFIKDTEIQTLYVLKSGTYYVSPSMNIAEILALLSSGQTEYIKISIPEGLTISKIGSILEENRVCSLEDFKQSTRNTEILKKYSIPSETCEGFLFPDTYFMNVGMNSDVVVTLMIDNFFEKIQTVPNLPEKTPEELFEIVNLASIVEREYKLDEEAPLIASVFRNRLKINMGLYSCATVEYIITEIQGKPHPERILTADTRIDSPYNTYLYAGLPPTPISNPGLVALDASTNTPKTKNYYFQVIDAEAGRHVFVKTLEEHKNNH